MTVRAKQRSRRKFKRITKTRRFRKGLVLTIMLLLFTASIYGMYQAGSYVVSSFSGTEPEVEEVEERVAEVPKPSPAKPKELCSCTNHSVKFKRDHYDRHREQARRLNNNRILTDEKIRSTEGIVKVENGKGFVIDTHKLTHSHAYLNRRAYLILLEMGNAYTEKVKGTKAEGSVFHISSLSRTAEQQKKLLRSSYGRNATRKESAHSFGASFDIWKLENAQDCHTARKAFESVLKDFQKTGKILLCPEGNCIHVTVKR